MAAMQLRHYQQEVLDKLADVPNILIGDEMGLGKTPTAVMLDVHRRDPFAKTGEQKTLVIAPLSVLDNWTEHFAEWAPDLCVRRIDPKKRDTLLSTEADVYVLHWEALWRMPSLLTMKWHHVIADEAHRLKGRKTRQTKAAHKLKANFKTALTGTPVINAPYDLWGILRYLWPKRYTSYWRFYEEYVLYEIQYPHGYHKILGPKNVEKLQAELEPFFIRRLKQDVLPELPDKYYTTITVDLYPQQRRVYNEMKKDMIAWLGENKNVPLIAPVVVARLTRLQQFSVAYAQLDATTGTVTLAEPSSKLDTLMEIIKDNPNEQMVVFTQYSQLVRLAIERFKRDKITYTEFTGDVPIKLRDLGVKQFQAGQTQVFIGTIKAGGVGVTLTAASTVIFLDRDWSPAMNLQAEDRLHRMGQPQAVQVIDIVARDSADPGKLATLALKEDWIRTTLGD